MPLLAGAVTQTVDVVVYGGASGGIIAAVKARQLGKTVALIEPGRHLGGMTAGGLGWVDGGYTNTVGGMALAFFKKVARPSPSRGAPFGGSNPWTLLPKDASAEFARLLASNAVPVYFSNRLDRTTGVSMAGNRIAEIRMENGDVFRARVFIDATYEGDLMACAGVTYRVGRESNAEYGEPRAGVLGPAIQQTQVFDYFVDPYVVPGDTNSGLLAGIQKVPLGTIGGGDSKTQAYNFRLCLTDTNLASRRVEITEPAGYDPARYEILRRYITARTAAGKSTAASDLLKFSPLAENKADINNNGPFSLDLIGESWDYPEGDYATRAAIVQNHIAYTQGLLWFLKSDAAVPAGIRTTMARFAYPSDEYTANGNWTPQLYVREARRMVGAYVMTQLDIPTMKTNAIGMGSYRVDSHHLQRVIYPSDYGNSYAGRLQNEGQFYAASTESAPYDIPYTAILPRQAECDNLLVTFCVSASHIAFASMRMEPVYMLLSESAAIAACQAIDTDAAVQAIDYQTLRASLKAAGQIFSALGDPPVMALEHFNACAATNRNVVGLNGGSGWSGAWEAATAPGKAQFVVGTQLVSTSQGVYFSNAGNSNTADSGCARWQAAGSAIVARPFAEGLNGTIWISALAQLTGGDRAYIWLDARAGVNGGNSGTFFGLDGEGGALTMRFNDTSAPYAEIFVPAAIATGTPHLLLARVELNHAAGDDRVAFWCDPDLSGGEAGLGAPAILSTSIATGDALGDTLDAIGIQLEDRDGDGVGSLVDAIRVSSLPNAFHDVTAPPTPYAVWLAGRPNPPAADQRRPADDPDHDGANNLVEYALDGNPTASDPDIWPEAALESDRMTLTYVRARAELAYWVETCGDLTTPDWTATGVDQGTGGVGGWVTAMVTRVTGELGRFLRLRIAQ